MIQRLVDGLYGAIICVLALSTVAIGNDTMHLDVTDLAQKHSDNVVLVERDGGHGTGWFVSHDGLVVTNFHVVEGADRWWVTLTDGTKVEAFVVALDEDNDLAILSTGLNRGLNFFTINPVGAKSGDLVAMIGYPLWLPITVTSGVIANDDMPDMLIPNGPFPALRWIDRISVDITSAPGNSGSPIVNDKGEVVCILNAGTPGYGYSFGIHPKWLVKMIQDYRDFGPDPLPSHMKSLEPTAAGGGEKSQSPKPETPGKSKSKVGV